MFFPCLDGDDDFADFQAAPTSPPATAPVTLATTPAPASSSAGLFDVLGAAPASAVPTMQATMQRPVQPVQPVQSAFSANSFTPLSPTSTGRKPTSPPPMGMGMGMGMGMQMNASRPTMTPTTPSFGSTASTAAAVAGQKSASSAGGFDDLWNLSLGSSKPSTPVTSAPKKSIKDLEKEKAQASIWGGAQNGGSANAFGGLGSSTGAASAPAKSSSGGFDDLLL